MFQRMAQMKNACRELFTPVRRIRPIDIHDHV
jgi:hypothetical protein